MIDTPSLIRRIAPSDAAPGQSEEAFGEIVARFQDMAFGCAFAILGDFHLAQDAAQEAFLTAWQKLPDLREPQAFPGWFRRIVLTQCHRLTRGKRLSFVPLEDGFGIPSMKPDPHAAAETAERTEKVLAAIRALPTNERMATALFYLLEYSQKEIAEFIGVPVTTVRKRLYSARHRLLEKMIDIFKENLWKHRPSRSTAFMRQVMARLRPFGKEDWESIAHIAYSLEPNFRAGNDAWLRTRQQFDQTRRKRRR